MQNLNHRIRHHISSAVSFTYEDISIQRIALWEQTQTESEQADQGAFNLKRYLLKAAVKI